MMVLPNHENKKTGREQHELTSRNQEKSGREHHNRHYLLTEEDFACQKPKHLLKILGITKKIPSHPLEYKAIATVFMASKHCFNFKNSSPILKPMPTDSEEAHAALAGKDAAAAGPGFDPVKLVEDVEGGILTTGVTHEDIKSNKKPKKVKAAVNSLASWIFWSPDQFEIVRSKPAHLLITGPFGTGKPMILMALALEARRAGKRVGFMSCTEGEDSILDQTIENFCTENEIAFVSKKVFTGENRGAVRRLLDDIKELFGRRMDAGRKHDYSTLHETFDCLYIDEIPPVSNINKKMCTPW